VLITPILLIAFNRPITTEKIFNSIREVRPLRLYFACDGARHDREGEDKKVARVREFVNKIDWNCEIKTLFQHENLGCKYGVSSAINWFFENEEQGIILEDDCLPNLDFFYFCENLLVRYKNDYRVMAITGNNFQCGTRHGEEAYYFSKYMHIWGWASWRRAWEHYDVEMKFWDKNKAKKSRNTLFNDSVEKKYWCQVFNKVKNGEIDTWDYQWIASIWQQGGVVATPNVNLVKNIGFGPDATHTTSPLNFLSNNSFYPLGELTHPSAVMVNMAADKHIFNYVFEGNLKRFPLFLLFLPRRILGRVYRFLKKKFS
jgi:hypothetical protein